MTMISCSRDEAPPLRVALCHLESLVCLPAINRLFIQMGDDIGLVILSSRFGSRHGGLVRQFVANVRRSGFRLTLWLGFDIVAAQVAGRIGRWIETLTRRRPRLASVRMLGERHGAAMLDVPAINGSDAILALRSYAPDVVLVMNFDQVLRRRSSQRAGPGYQRSSIAAAGLARALPGILGIGEGRAEAGVSLHLIEDENIDAGAVLAQRTRPLDRSRSVAETTAAFSSKGQGWCRRSCGRCERAGLRGGRRMSRGRAIGVFLIAPTLPRRAGPVFGCVGSGNWRGC